MKGRIPRSFIDNLINQTNVIDIVNERIQLKKQGQNFTTCCPFHNEKTPSFIVNDRRQTYHCFGCGAHGNSIDFVMEFDNVSFIEAIETLAQRLNLEIPRENLSSQELLSLKTSSDSYQIMFQITEHYNTKLKDYKNRDAMDYLIKRGLTTEIIDLFELGFSENAWGTISNHQYFKNHLVSLENLGISIKSQKHHTYYDRFRNRIMFPIRNTSGKVVGFGGRVLDNEKPKYLNSPETILFHKQKELYGLYELLKVNRNPKSILIVEGYMDVISLHQAGFQNTVACLGTATSDHHLRTLFRYTNEVICCYDGDDAGQSAAWKTLTNALKFLENGKEIKFISLNKDEDPDSFIKNNGKEAFTDKIINAESLANFTFEYYEKNDQYSNKSTLTKNILEFIELIPGNANKLILTKELSKNLFINEEQLIKLNSQHKVKKVKKVKHIKKTPLRVTISLLLQNPQFILNEVVPSSLQEVAELKIPGLPILIELLEICAKNPYIKTGQLIENWRDRDEYSYLKILSTWEIPMQDESGDNYFDYFLDSLDSVYALCIDKQIENLQVKSNKIGLTDLEKKELTRLILSSKD